MNPMSVREMNAMSVSDPIATKETLVVSATLSEPETIKHPPSHKTDPQIIAKHHVSNQQLGNALSALMRAKNYPTLSQRKPKFETSSSSATSIRCRMCWRFVASYTITITRANLNAKRSVCFTTIQFHHLKIHGHDLPDKEYIVSYLDLKPNTCYEDVIKPQLFWKYMYSFSEPRYEYQKGVTELYRYDNKNGIRAIVRQHRKHRILLLSNLTPSQDVIVEGIPVSGVPRSSHVFQRYRLEWTNTILGPDWLYDP